MNFDVIIWGSVGACVVILIPLFVIFTVFDYLRGFFNWIDR